MSQSRDWQKTFVASVTLAESRKPCILEKILDKRYSHRLDAYHQSFLGRTVIGLSQALLQPLLHIFGENLVYEVVARYFAAHEPQHPSMMIALNFLPDFIRQSANDWYGFFFADIANLSLAQAKLLHGPDPIAGSAILSAGQNLERKIELPPALITTESNADLFAVWMNWTQNHPVADLMCFQQSPATNLLLLKMSALELTAIPISNTLLPLLIQLCKGVTIQSALDNLSEEQIERLDEKELHNFLSAVKS